MQYNFIRYNMFVYMFVYMCVCVQNTYHVRRNRVKFIRKYNFTIGRDGLMCVALCTRSVNYTSITYADARGERRWWHTRPPLNTRVIMRARFCIRPAILLSRTVSIQRLEFQK